MNRKKLGIIIFVRLGSKRLPNKALIKIKNISTLEHLYKRVKKINTSSKIIIATTTKKLDNKIVKFCKLKKIIVFRGSDKNVANRAIECCKKYNFDSFLRVCADRIFFDYNLAKQMIHFYKKYNFEIVTNCLIKSYPKGLSCEIISLNTFKKNLKYMKTPSDREHIFNYFYRNNKKFKIKNFKSSFPKKIFNMSMALDTNNDLSKIKKTFKELEINPNTKTQKIIKYFFNKFY